MPDPKEPEPDVPTPEQDLPPKRPEDAGDLPDPLEGDDVSVPV